MNGTTRNSGDKKNRCLHTQLALQFSLLMPNDHDISQCTNPEDKDLSDLPELIDCDPEVEPQTAPPQPQVFINWANFQHHSPIPISMSYVTDRGEWVVVPFPTNGVPPPSIRMITDNVATQFRAHRTDNVD